jgi:hypothetical protein
MKKTINKIIKDDFTDKVVLFHIGLFPLIIIFDLYPFEKITDWLIGAYCLLVIFSACIFIHDYDEINEKIRDLEKKDGDL